VTPGIVLTRSPTAAPTQMPPNGFVGNGIPLPNFLPSPSHAPTLVPTVAPTTAAPTPVPTPSPTSNLTQTPIGSSGSTSANLASSDSGGSGGSKFFASGFVWLLLGLLVLLFCIIPILCMRAPKKATPKRESTKRGMHVENGENHVGQDYTPLLQITPGAAPVPVPAVHPSQVLNTRPEVIQSASAAYAPSAIVPHAAMQQVHFGQPIIPNQQVSHVRFTV